MRRALLAACVLASACLGPRPDPSAFFLLSPAAAPTGGAPVPVVLGLGPISLPGYLDRPQIVVRVSDHEIALAASDRWAEPLRDLVARTLAENLATLLPASSFVEYPWYPATAPDFGVAVDVRRFEVDVGGTVVLDATWRITAAGEVVDRRATRFEEPADGADRSAAVAAQSRALGALSREIADAVRRAR